MYSVTEMYRVSQIYSVIQMYSIIQMHSQSNVQGQSNAQCQSNVHTLQDCPIRSSSLYFLESCNNKIQLISFLENGNKGHIQGREITTIYTLLIFFFLLDQYYTYCTNLPQDSQFSYLVTYQNVLEMYKSKHTVQCANITCIKSTYGNKLYIFLIMI